MSDAAAKLVSSAVQARREGRLSDAKRDLAEAIRISRESGGQMHLALALRELGETERKLRNPAAALQHYGEAVAILRQTGPPLTLPHTVRHLGDVYRESGCLDLAAPCYDQALVIYRRQNDTQSLDYANAVRSLAVLKTGTGQLPEAPPLWEQARELYASLNIAEGVAGCTAQLAKL
jgi:tetratricopeptide (TPR) repeat protein